VKFSASNIIAVFCFFSEVDFIRSGRMILTFSHDAGDFEISKHLLLSKGTYRASSGKDI
jgi:hypothetical protein